MLFAKGDLKKLNIGFYFGNEQLLCTEHFDSSTQIFKGEKVIQSQYFKTILSDGFVPRTDDEAEILLILKNLSENEFIASEICGKKLNFLKGEKGDSCYYGLCPTFDLTNYTLNEFCNFSFIYASKENNIITFTLYHVFPKENDIFIEKVENHSLQLVNGKGLVLEDLDIDSFYEFLKKDEIDFLLNQESFFYNIMFDFFSYEKGFLDIYNCLPQIRIKAYSSVELVATYYWFTQHEYYLFIEKMIKVSQTEKIKETNPYYTHKSIPDVSEVKTISSRNRALLAELQLLSSSYIEAIYELENDDKIGNNGVTLLLEALKTIELLRKKFGWEVDLFCPSFHESEFKRVQTIIHAFDITPKALIDRGIREMFSNNFDFSTFISYVYDYILMCKNFSIKLENKLPKDVIKRHEMLLTRRQEMKNEVIKSLFSSVAKENKSLIREFDESDYFICVPETISDLTKEGFDLNHCVGSYAYPIIEKSSKIFFIRKKSCPNISFVTVELDKRNHLIQARSFGNGMPKKEVLDFINKWIETIK